MLSFRGPDKKSSQNFPTINASDMKHGKTYVGSFVLDTEKNTNMAASHNNTKII
jgi:hypothetical protein